MLTPEWIACFETLERLIVGFSGGLDSTVLLHALAACPQLRNKMLAVHINHGLSAHALSWQKHCEDFCRQSGIAFIAQAVAFDRSANIEEGARTARYEVFASFVSENSCLVLGHHLDDQAETVLLQLFRGAGIDGLAAMTELGPWEGANLARPLLSYSREQLEHYAVLHELTWIEDESNQDVRYSRNYLRQTIMPLLKHKWAGVANNLARTAMHCQQARENLDELALHDSPELLASADSLSISSIKSLSTGRLVNVIRTWLKKNQIKMPSAVILQRIIDELICAASDATPLVCWDTIQIRRYRDCLYIDNKAAAIRLNNKEWVDFPQPLILEEQGVHLTACKSEQGLFIAKDATLSIQFRQGGELFFWHGQNKQLKKLFQLWGIPPWLRGRIPLLYVDGQLAAVIGYAISDLFFSRDNSNVWNITNIPNIDFP